MAPAVSEKAPQKKTSLRRRNRRKFTSEYKASILDTIKGMEDVDERLKFLKKEHLYPALVERWETPRIIRSDKEIPITKTVSSDMPNKPASPPPYSRRPIEDIEEENRRLKLEVELYKEMNESLLRKLATK